MLGMLYKVLLAMYGEVVEAGCAFQGWNYLQVSIVRSAGVVLKSNS